MIETFLIMSNKFKCLFFKKNFVNANEYKYVHKISSVTKCTDLTFYVLTFNMDTLQL